MFITRWLLSLMVFVEKVIEFFHKPDCLTSWSDVVEAQTILKDGDVLLSCTDWELSNIFIPGPFKHAAIYFGGYVYEASTKGVRKVHIAEWILKKDHVGMARVNFTLPNLDTGKVFLDEQLGKPYDYDFLDTESSGSWYCSLYVYKFLCTASPDFSGVFVLKKTFGEKTVTPNDLWQAEEKLTRIKMIN